MRLTGIALFLLLFCPFPASAAAPGDFGAGAAVSAPGDPELPARADLSAYPQKSFHMSDTEGLALARSLLESNRLSEAGQLYVLLLQSRIPEVQVEALFQLGQIALLEREYNRAVEYFLIILNRFPDLARVRLELARAYFLNENYEEARFQFELVKGGSGLPPEVLEKVDFFLESIRRQKNWTLDFGLSLTPDSNINQVSGASEECIATVYGLLCRDLKKKESGLGLRVNATADYYHRFSKDMGLRSTLGLYMTDFPGSFYDDYIFYAATGPRYIWGSGEISLQPTFTKRWIGGKPYSEAYGGRLDAQKNLGRLFLNFGGAYAENFYNNENFNAFLRGETYSAYLRPRYILTSQSFIQAGLRYERDNTADGIYGSNSLTHSLGGYYFFRYGVLLFAEGSLTDVLYHKRQNYITEDYRIGSARHKDRLYGLSVALAVNWLEHLGITPMLQYNYTRRSSNIWSYDYSRHRVNLSFNFRF
jgi:tetratricopeptide (TPR) repeat protein